MSNLAMIHYRQGLALRQYEHIRQGLDLQFKVSRAREQKMSLGQTSLYLNERLYINALADIMRSHYALGDFEKAAPLAKIVVARRVDLVGHDDLLTLDAEQDLAAVYRAQRRLDEAERLERDLLQRRVVRWGLGHDEVLHSARMLWYTLQKQEKHEEAHELEGKYSLTEMDEEDSIWSSANLTEGKFQT